MLEITNYNCSNPKNVQSKFHDKPLTIIINGFNTSFPFHKCEFNMNINGTHHVHNNILINGSEIISREIFYPVTNPIKIHFEDQSGNNMTFDLIFYDKEGNIIQNMNWYFELYYFQNEIHKWDISNNTSIGIRKNSNITNKQERNEAVGYFFNKLGFECVNFQCDLQKNMCISIENGHNVYGRNKFYFVWDGHDHQLIADHDDETDNKMVLRGNGAWPVIHVEYFDGHIYRNVEDNVNWFYEINIFGSIDD